MAGSGKPEMRRVYQPEAKPLMAADSSSSGNARAARNALRFSAP